MTDTEPTTIQTEPTKDFFDELKALNTDENPCDYFVVAAFQDGKAGIYSTVVDPKLISYAFKWGEETVNNPQPTDKGSVNE